MCFRHTTKRLSTHSAARARRAAVHHSTHTHIHTYKIGTRKGYKQRALARVSANTRRQCAQHDCSNPSCTSATMSLSSRIPYKRSKQCLSQCYANPCAPDCGCCTGADTQQQAAPSGSARPRVLHVLGVCPRNQTPPLSCLLHDTTSELLRPPIKHRPPMRLGMLKAPQ